MSRSIEEWKKVIVDNIIATAKESRLDNQLFGRVYGDCTKANVGRILRRSGKPKAKPLQEGEPPTMLPALNIEEARAASVKFEAQGEFRTWFEDQNYHFVDPYVNGIAREVATCEMAESMNCLIEEAKQYKRVIPSTEARLTKQDVIKAVEWIGDNEYHADTLVVSLKHRLDLVERSEIIPWWHLPGYVSENNGPQFVGIMGGLNVYGIRELPREISLVYEKEEIWVNRTPMTCEFDDPSDPKKLLISEQCLAYAVDVGALAKVSLKQK